MKYCKKHNQYYMDHVPECPVCVGEKMYEKILKERKKEKDDDD